MVELDIAACRLERDIAADWVKHRNTINEELEKIGMSEAEWCRRELGCSIQTMRRRVQLLTDGINILSVVGRWATTANMDCFMPHFLPPPLSVEALTQ